MNVSGCEDCRRSTAGTCWRHTSRTIGASVALAAALAHHHVWHYDGFNGPYLVYHCDDHDPPVVRMVWHTDTVAE